MTIDDEVRSEGERKSGSRRRSGSEVSRRDVVIEGLHAGGALALGGGIIGTGIYLFMNGGCERSKTSYRKERDSKISQINSSDLARYEEMPLEVAAVKRKEYLRRSLSVKGIPDLVLNQQIPFAKPNSRFDLGIRREGPGFYPVLRCFAYSYGGSGINNHNVKNNFTSLYDLLNEKISRKDTEPITVKGIMDPDELAIRIDFIEAYGGVYDLRKLRR